MLASGFAGLGFQIVWTQQCALWLGHEAPAVLAVVTAFFAGLGVGALTLGRRIDGSTRPARWYAVCELVIAAWGVTLAVGLAPIAGAMLDLTGAQPSPVRQAAVTFVGTFLLLLPATAAMGATLPAMVRVLAQVSPDEKSVATLYACNTLGAVIGVITVAFWWVPEIGLMRTAIGCAAFNVACAFVASRLPMQHATEAPVRLEPSGHSALALLAFTGVLGIGYEVLVVRVLSQVAEDTVYTFAILLTVYLLGTAVGAATYRRWFESRAAPHQLRDRLLRVQSAACLLGTVSLWQAERLREAMHGAFGASMATALMAEAAIGVAAFAVPTVVMGALFSHLSRAARGQGHAFGSALGANTMGAALAPALFGVLLAPTLGPKLSLLLVAAGYLVPVWRKGSRATTLLSATAVGALAVFAPPLAFVDVPQGGRVVSYQEGALAAVSVIEDADGVSRLRIDNRQQEGSSATRLADGRQGLLPLLLHPAPRRALFLGLGTGVTASTAALDPTVKVDAVELLPEVITASRHFDVAGADGMPNPRPQLITADARRFVRTTDQRYDLIVADNFHPARSGSGALYTVEHFQAVHDRLADDGLFCQWLPLHQLDIDTLRSIVRSFTAVYPGAAAMLATNSLETPVLGLIAHRDGRRFDATRVRERLGHAALPRPLIDFGISDDLSLFGGFVAGPSALVRFAAGAPLNTDDRPVVAYRAPRITYAPNDLPRDRLDALLRALTIEPAELVVDTDAAFAPKLAAYWKARDRFIEVGQTVRPSSDPRRMLAQVREPLLAVLRISPDFRPAYDPLLRMAAALARTDPAAAHTLLDELQRLQPGRADAAELLRGLSSTP